MTPVLFGGYRRNDAAGTASDIVAYHEPDPVRAGRDFQLVGITDPVATDDLGLLRLKLAADPLPELGSLRAVGAPGICNNVEIQRRIRLRLTGEVRRLIENEMDDSLPFLVLDLGKPAAQL